jgi:hypothetical protein
MPLTQTDCTRPASTIALILTESHSRRRHGQRTCAITGTWGSSGCACWFAHVEAQCERRCQCQHSGIFPLADSAMNLQGLTDEPGAIVASGHPSISSRETPYATV